MEQRTRKIILSVVVTILMVASVYTMYTTTSNYVEAAKATHRLGGEVIELEMEEENVVLLTFRFNNTSSLDIILQNIQVNIYANGRYLGNFDRREKTPLKPGISEIVFRAELHPIYLESLEQERETSEMILWFISGGAVIELPFEEMTITISIQEYWVTE